MTERNSTDVLKPCPFCGCANLIADKIYNVHYLECQKCDTVGPNGATRDEAVAAWNTRAALQQSRSAVEAIPTAALYALRHGQQQADMDGTFVTVSRQAIDEVLDAIDAALSQESA